MYLILIPANRYIGSGEQFEKVIHIGTSSKMEPHGAWVFSLPYLVYSKFSLLLVAIWSVQTLCNDNSSCLLIENTFQRCFHVTVPEIGSEHSEETEPTFEHYILQAHHPCNCQLVIRHPLSLRDVKLWDLSKTKAFTFEFFPNPLFRFQLTDELLSSDASSESEQVETVYFLSSLVARQALDLVELLLSTRMPKLYLKANKHVYTRQTSQGDVAKAVTFDFKSSSGPSGQQVLSKSFVDFEPKLPSYSPSRIGDKDASPYAVVDLPSMCTVAARLPPTDLLRPGIAQSRVLGDCDYVSMSRVEICDPPLPDNALTVGIQSSESDHDYDDVAEDVSVFDDDYELMAAGVTPSLTALTNCKVGGKQSEEEASSTDEPSSEVM